MSHDRAAALIIGLSIQGLALARALTGMGVKVYAMERRNPGATLLTRYAKVLLVEKEMIEKEGLVQTLLEMRRSLPHDDVVIFPASDKTVRTLARHWSSLRQAYRLSWGDCVETIEALTIKSNLPAWCQAAQVLHPATRVLSGAPDLHTVGQLRFPVVLKPATPPGPFKAIVAKDLAEVQRVMLDHPETRPLVVQEWIDGGDDKLYFCTLLLDHGKQLAYFTGRKIRSSPTGLGRGVVMETHWDEQVYQSASRFASQFEMSGPISIEFKQAPDGSFWLIEPNAGRTEYCVDVVIQSGINLAYLEYCQVLGRSIPEPAEPASWTPVIWYDTEKEPFCYWSLAFQQRSIRPFGKRAVFPYLGYGDTRPLRRAIWTFLSHGISAVRSRLSRAMQLEPRLASVDR